MLIKKSEGFTLIKLLIAVALSGLIILAVSSVDISSRRFFEVIKEKGHIQAEAAMAMEHIVKNLQLGIGDMSNPGTFGNPPGANNSRGFYILDSSMNLDWEGSRIRIKLDEDNDGKFGGAPDRIAEYRLQADRIRYDPNVLPGPSPPEWLTDMAISDCQFYIDGANNRVHVIITARSEPTQPAGPDNPETILTSSITLRAMSIN